MARRHRNALLVRLHGIGIPYTNHGGVSVIVNRKTIQNISGETKVYVNFREFVWEWRYRVYWVLKWRCRVLYTNVYSMYKDFCAYYSS